MIENIKKWISQILTGKDNATVDLGRVSWIISMGTVIGHSVYAAATHAVVDLVQLATALGTVAGAHGLALWAKKDTEPDNVDVNK